MGSTGPGTNISIPVDGQRADIDFRDLPPTAARYLRNWLLRSGKFCVRPGYMPFADEVDERPMAYVRYKHNDGTERFVMGTDVGWRHYDTGTKVWDDITESGNLLTASALNHQVFCVMDMSGVTTLIGVNGKDVAKKWNGDAANYSDLGGSPPKSVAAVVIFDRLILGNLKSGSTISPYAVDASNNKDPEAGYGGINISILADTSGEIVVMRKIGNQRASIHKSDALYEAVAQGSLYPFAYNLIKADILGPVSPRALISLEDGLEWWMAKDGAIYQYDTVSILPVSKAAQAHILNTIAPNQLGKVWGFCDRRRREVWFFYPSINSTECLHAIVVSRDGYSVWPIKFTNITPTAGGDMWVDSSITIGELSELTIGDLTGTLGEFATNVPRLIIGDLGGQTFEESGYDDDGSAIVSEFETSPIKLAPPEYYDPRRFNQIDEIDSLFVPANGSQTVTVEVGKSDAGEDVVFEQLDTVDIGGSGPFVTQYRVIGRSVGVRYSASSSRPIQFRGAIASGKIRGNR